MAWGPTTLHGSLAADGDRDNPPLSARRLTGEFVGQLFIGRWRADKAATATLLPVEVHGPRAIKHADIVARRRPKNNFLSRSYAQHTYTSANRAFIRPTETTHTAFTYEHRTLADNYPMQLRTKPICSH